MRNIKLLDCTLRDGGHVVDGVFGESVIRQTIRKLAQSKVDIIEAGFLWSSVCDKNVARFRSIADLKRILPDDLGSSKISLMADSVNLDHLEPYDGTVEYIRLSFHSYKLEEHILTARGLIEKGYKVFINPINCNVYTDYEYLKTLERVNELKPYGFSIVDTFGALQKRDLTHIYSLVENNLDRNIVVGLHLHENLGMAFHLAQNYLEMANPRRAIVIDGSLLGMGRIPGNLCIEQIKGYMNEEYGTNYNTDPAYDAIDEYIAPIKQAHSWGYSIPYALSAKFGIHRTYAEYLTAKNRLTTSDIKKILSQVEPSKAESFDEQYIEKLYEEYITVHVDDSAAIKLITQFVKHKEILIVAPGASLNEPENREKIIEFSQKEHVVKIGVNYLPDFVDCDYMFCTNRRRYDVISNKDKTKFIIASNVKTENSTNELIISYNKLAYFGDHFCEDSTLSLIHLFKRLGIKKVFIAGFDGFAPDKKLHFQNDVFAANTVPGDHEGKVKKILSGYLSDIDITFLTSSTYQN